MDLDRKTMKLLASDTRSDLIKALQKRRKTLSELSRELGLAPATVTEHLKALEKGGLVKKIDEGRKWKYYELTKKTRKMTQPQVPVFLVIASLVVVLFAGVFFVGGQTVSAPQATSSDKGIVDLSGAASDGVTLGIIPTATVSANCEDNTVFVKNPTEEKVNVLFKHNDGSTIEMAVAAGEEINETNVTNGTIVTAAGSIDYFC